MRVKSTSPRKLESTEDCQQIISGAEENPPEQEVPVEKAPVSETAIPISPIPSEVATTFNEATSSPLLSNPVLLERTFKPKVSTPTVVAKIEQYKRENPHIYGREMRERLINEGITANPPSISTINRLVRTTESERTTAQLTRMFPWHNERQQAEVQLSGLTNIQLPTSHMSGLLLNQSADLSSMNPYMAALQSAVLNRLFAQPLQPGSPLLPVYPASPTLKSSPGCPNSAPGSPLAQCFGRITYNKKQLDILEAAYNESPAPKLAERDALARKIQIPESKLQIWFSNRRARDRRRGNSRSPSDSSIGYVPPNTQTTESTPVKCEEPSIITDE